LHKLEVQQKLPLIVCERVVSLSVIDIHRVIVCDAMALWGNDRATEQKRKKKKSCELYLSGGEILKTGYVTGVYANCFSW
jgi:hypothetical protein